MRPIIKIENVSKRYWLGQRDSYGMLRDRIATCFKAPLRAAASRFRRSDSRRADSSSIWALRDVSLVVEPGEVLGIIGRNGAGKSTLLKILSRITEPTSGRVKLYGRVGCLLEVGTGFHSELTGRENIFLSGAILGMRRAEIARKFDEIVAFAEIEQFIDTPVKHFSSGMYTRLAFAVAAHLEPEILLVDEILAVGDIAFQKKCLGKMGDVARAGRTVVLVSHQLNQIRRLCQRVVWIDAASVRQDGPTHEVTSAYESAMFSGDSNGAQQNRTVATKARFLRWEIAGAPAGQPHVLSTLGLVTVNFVVESAEPITSGEHGVALFNAERQLMWARAAQNLTIDTGVHIFSHTFPSLPRSEEHTSELQ